MPVGVRGDLVAGIGDTPHQGGIALGHPAHGEERPGVAMLCQQLQQRIDGGFDPAGEVLPPADRHVVFEGADLEILFDVYGKELYALLGRGHTTPPPRSAATGVSRSTTATSAPESETSERAVGPLCRRSRSR